MGPQGGKGLKTILNLVIGITEMKIEGNIFHRERSSFLTL